MKKQATIKEKSENGVSEPVEEKLVKPSAAKLADKASKPADEKPRFLKSTVKTIDKTNDKGKSEDKAVSDKLPERPILKSVRTIDDKSKDKSVTIVDRKQDKNDVAKNTSSVNDKTPNGKVSTNSLTKPGTKVEEKTTLKSKVEDKVVAKPKFDEKTKTKPEEKSKPESKTIKPKSEEKVPEKSKADSSQAKSTLEEKSKMATKPPTPLDKSPSKVSFYAIYIEVA